MQVGTMSFGVIPKEQFTELSRVKLFRPLLLPLGDHHQPSVEMVKVWPLIS